MSKQQDYKVIIDLVEQAFAVKVGQTPDIASLLYVASEVADDDYAAIKYLINNQHLLTSELITNLVEQQLRTYHLEPESAFTIPIKSDVKGTVLQRWQTYLDKLDQVLYQVTQRYEAGYELNLLLPPQQQLLELQKECYQLTTEFHGVGNISCFYRYYIRMCTAAHITNYEYWELPMWRSSDAYICAMDLDARKKFMQAYKDEVYYPFIKQGGQWALGRSEIDATSISNIFYYKHAKQLLYLLFAKQIALAAMRVKNEKLLDYGQLPQANKERLWQLIQDHFPADATEDSDSIYYKFAKFCNRMPGACFTDVDNLIPEAKNISAAKLHEIIKVAGIQSKKLILLSRNVTENWTPKRYLILHWIRKYPLLNLRPALNPKLRIVDSLEEGLIVQGKYTKRKERLEIIDKLLEQVNLKPEYKWRYPHEFSGGERQRLCIARALTVQPHIVVCDEPTSSLDVSVQSQVLKLLSTLQNEHDLTYLFITHDLAVVKYLAHRVAVMYCGRIVEFGLASEILQDPKHPYTQALLEAVPRIDKPRNSLAGVISGEIASPLNPPSGCHFHPRCKFAKEICKTNYPRETHISDTHMVKCVLYESKEQI